MAPEDNGTRCSRPDFVRSSGIVQIASLQVELRPPRPSHLSAPTCRQHQQFHTELGARVRPRSANPFQRRPNPLVRQCRLVLDADTVPGKRGTDGVAGRVVLPVPLGDRPLHHGSDPLADHPRRHALPVPEVVRASSTPITSAVVILLTGL